MYNHPDDRPRFLSLTEFRFPLNAKLSGMHRITGILLLLCLIGFLGKIHLIILHPDVELIDIHQHWIITTLISSFWVLLSFHWLTGLRHLLAEHFTQIDSYKFINSCTVSYLLIFGWLAVSLYIFNIYWL